MLYNCPTRGLVYLLSEANRKDRPTYSVGVLSLFNENYINLENINSYSKYSILLGSSVCEGRSYEQGESIPTELAKFLDYPVISMANSGSNTSSDLQYLVSNFIEIKENPPEFIYWYSPIFFNIYFSLDLFLISKETTN